MAIQLDLDKICAICLQESNDMSSISDYDKNQIKISDKITTCFPEFNDLQDNKPEKICSICVEDLDYAYRFHNNCETAVLLFRCTTVSDGLQKKNGDGLTIETVHGDDLKAQTKDEEQTEYSTEFCELEQLEYGYKEEHLEDENEEAYEIPIDTGSDSNTLDNEYQNQLDISEILSQNEEDTEEPEQKKLKKTYIKIKSPKTNKKVENSPKICEICGNTYKYQHALNSHMRRHLNVKPFNCECCDKAFVSNIELRRHMRVHTGDKPYGCIYCERKFSDYGSRIKHERTHTGERPFVCPTCHKSFAYAHVLSVHLRTHTGEKKFQCSECSKGFTKKSYMLAHMEQHRRSALIALKEEEESQENSYLKQQKSKKMLNSVPDCSDVSMDPCITTYIVEEIADENDKLKVLEDIGDVRAESKLLPCNENVLKIR